MDRALSANLYIGLIALMMLHRAFIVQGHSLLSPGNHMLGPQEETNVQNKILALLLHKSLEPLPMDRNDAIGLEMARKITELQELEALKKDLDLQRELASDTVMPLPSKRGLKNPSKYQTIFSECIEEKQSCAINTDDDS
ncbi:urotensin 2 domain containing [Conger conger]|uniref:urotensin 2 domain containing n=1 Tax=Conger conger TaxID=82655 RepID=UPI002A5A1C06|nr:urotensin 2 domain containing [Conger conger]